MEKVNFERVTSEILDFYGLTEKQLAERLGVSQPTVHKIKVGKTADPSHSLGEKLLALHRARLPLPEGPPNERG